MNWVARSVAAGAMACGAALAVAAGWSLRLADGRQIAIVADGTAGDNAQWLERRNPDGSLDRQFGNAGRVVFSLGADSPGPRSVRLDNSGRVLVVGAAIGMEGHSVPASLRFLPDGRIDLSWGLQGRSLIPSPDAQAYGADVLALPDGSALVLGQIEGEAVERAALWRLGGDGAADSGFGAAGVMRANGLETSEALALQLDDDGAALIAVQTFQQGLPWLEVHRWQIGQDQPQRVAHQPMPPDWQGPATLARRGGTWQWFDASQAAGSGGVPLAAVAATAVWTKGTGPGAGANAAAQANPTEGSAAWNPFSTEPGAVPAAPAISPSLPELGWLALALAILAALAGWGWWRWRHR